MRYIIMFLMAGLFNISFAQTIKILSYNIHHGNPPSKGKEFVDLEAIAKVIKDANVDIVAIQEVDNNVSRSNFENQAEVLAELTNMECLFTKSIPLEEGAYGTAILTKHKILSKRRYDLPMPVKSENRTLTIVDVKLPNGKTFSLANTHLDLKEDNKIEQAKFIIELGELYSRPLILAGDLNAKPDTKPIQILQEYFSLNSNRINTFPNVNPNQEIDYIMVSKHSKFKWKKYEVLKEASYPSDHLPLYAEIEIK